MGNCFDGNVLTYISILLILICSIAISFRNKLNDQKTCGQNRDKKCASGGFMNLQFSLLVIGLIVGILYISGAIYVIYSKSNSSGFGSRPNSGHGKAAMNYCQY